VADQQRQPKGTQTGGQFAGSVNPESTVVLTVRRTSLPLRESPRRLLQRDARLRVKEVNRLARSAQCQRIPDGQRCARVNDGDELMAAGREVDVFVVTEKLDDVDGGVQLQAAATSRVPMNSPRHFEIRHTVMVSAKVEVSSGKCFELKRLVIIWSRANATPLKLDLSHLGERRWTIHRSMACRRPLALKVGGNFPQAHGRHSRVNDFKVSWASQSWPPEQASF